MTAIRTENLSFSFSGEPLLESLTVSFEEGCFCAIAGPNGAGKSTFLRLLMRLLKSKKGDIYLNEINIKKYNPKKLARQVAWVRQEYIPAFDFTVYQTVMMSRMNRPDYVLFDNAKDREIVAWALEQTETTGLLDRQLWELSGGERQRVFVARALAQETPVLLLDEPTNHLDLKHQVLVFDLLKKLQFEQNKTVLAVTHDINLAFQYCDRALLLDSKGQYYWGETSDVFKIDRIKEVFEVDGFDGNINTKSFFIPLGRKKTDILSDNNSIKS